MECLSFLVLLRLLTSSIGFYLYLTRNFNYWKNRGINGPKPIAGIGSLYGLLFKPLVEYLEDNSRKYGKISGGFLGDRPFLVVADPELIKAITIRDFHAFADRTDLRTGDPITESFIFLLKGDEWKKMRSIINPTFSSGKMRRMHPIILDCVQRLDNVLERDYVAKGVKQFEAKKLMSNYTLDVIARCSFATRIDVYSEANNEFVTNARQMYRSTWRIWLTSLLGSISPKLVQAIGLSHNSPKLMNYFESVIRSIISRRRSENTKHDDYLQLMINAMDKVEDIEEDIDDNDDSAIKNTRLVAEVSELDVLSNLLLFLVAGSDTTTTSLSNLFYLMAVNQECQQRLYEELEEYGPDFDYETIARMPYLEACVAETLRMYSPVVFVPRVTTEEYTFEETGLKIPKQMQIYIDYTSVHHSDEYYPEPMKFKPERFLPENKHKLVPYTHMPFGMGPRNCPGMRFALMEIKTVAAHLIHKYRFFATDRTPTELKSKKFEMFFITDDIMFIGMESRN